MTGYELIGGSSGMTGYGIDSSRGRTSGIIFGVVSIFGVESVFGVGSVFGLISSTFSFSYGFGLVVTVESFEEVSFGIDGTSLGLVSFFLFLSLSVDKFVVFFFG